MTEEQLLETFKDLDAYSALRAKETRIAHVTQFLSGTVVGIALVATLSLYILDKNIYLVSLPTMLTFLMAQLFFIRCERRCVRRLQRLREDYYLPDFISMPAASAALGPCCASQSLEDVDRGYTIKLSLN